LRAYLWIIKRMPQDSAALQKTIRLINSLPDDVMRHIYEEYFVGIDKCNKYLKLLESDESRNLKYEHLLEPTRWLLEHPCAIEYLCSKHAVFKQMYVKHYIQHNKSFVLMDMTHSFILSILMYLYH
jgi:hypothetical protein